MFDHFKYLGKMKKIILAMLLSLTFTAQGLAQDAAEAEAAVETAVETAMEPATEATDGGFLSHSYVVVKYLSMQGGSYEHGTKTITGAAGSGFGLDLGYKLDDHMAVEFAYSAGSNTLEEKDTPTATATATTTTTTGHNISPLASSTATTGAVSTGDGKFTSMGLNFVYSHHYKNGFTSVLKGGYVSESEILTIAGHETTATNGGIAVIAGAEYKLMGHNEVVVEIEKAFIDGPKGMNIFVGWKMGFGH